MRRGESSVAEGALMPATTPRALYPASASSAKADDSRAGRGWSRPRRRRPAAGTAPRRRDHGGM